VSEDSDSESGEEGRPSPVQRALDIFVFAPVGAALTVAEDLPGVISKGRERVEGEIRNARVIGQFVVTQGQQDLTQRIGKLLHGFGGSSDGAVGSSDGAGIGHSGAAQDTGAEDTATGDTGNPVEPVEESAPVPTPKPPADPADTALVEGALAGYDTLSASQVVRRLESLSPDELRAVHRHEASHRNRRTILHRTNQLLGGPAHSEAT
jgi:hypothetical protein